MHNTSTVRGMDAAQVDPSVVTFTSMLDACGRSRPPRHGTAKRVFQRMLEMELQPNKARGLSRDTLG